MKSKPTEQEAYHKLTRYTLAHPNSSSIHQHVVDAFAAQLADEKTKPIAVVLALVGLYLYVEKNLSGKKVQFAQMELASSNKSWPTIVLPAQRGEITIFDVLKAHPGKPRDDAIAQWCASVWEAYRESREIIIGLLK